MSKIALRELQHSPGLLPTEGDGPITWSTGSNRDRTACRASHIIKVRKMFRFVFASSLVLEFQIREKTGKAAILTMKRSAKRLSDSIL